MKIQKKLGGGGGRGEGSGWGGGSGRDFFQVSQGPL